MNIRYKAIKSQHAVQQLLPFGEVRWDFYYNPLSRLIQTDFPDNTTARVEFDVWQQRNHDQNDCDTSSAHYNTPQVIDLDVLGRAFQINDDNGNTTTHEFYTTHNQLDITGRIVQVTDALERIMTVNVYALSEKHQLKVQNIDSATRWMLNDTLGNPRYVWDSRDHRIKTLYDALLRPTQMLLKTGNNPEIITQQIIYGTSSALNNIGQIIEIDAQDGKTSYAYDFKGNLTEQQKQFAQDYQNELDWSGSVTLLNALTIATTYDALNRPVTITQPDSTIITNVYDKGALLQAVASTGSATVSIQNITYNPRGQREDIYYGNNTKTKYYYNPLNFRITRILTTRNSAANNAVKSKYMA
jgi:YD repeat-containing protein